MTGGIGGVHRGGEITLDISADLTELGRTDITVVCAGAKSILDIGRTLEYLETQGVTVVGYGTNEFPAFFSPKSGFSVPLRLDTPAEVAGLISANDVMKLGSGILVAVPIPQQYAAETEFIESAIQSALKEADSLKISGREITPFLLDRIAKLTKGESLAANIALIKNNAVVGAKIAVEFVKILNGTTTATITTATGATTATQTTTAPIITTTTITNPTTMSTTTTKDRGDYVVVLGGAVVDVIGQPYGQLRPFTSNPGTLSLSIGGVGRNMAEGLARLRVDTQLISAVGKDAYGDMVINYTSSAGMNTDTIFRADSVPTGVYLATLDEKGDLAVAIAATSIFDMLTPDYVAQYEKLLVNAKFIVMDANAPAPTLNLLANFAFKNKIDIWFEPTSIAKGVKIVDSLSFLTYISPNRGELIALVRALDGDDAVKFTDDVINDVEVYKPLVARLVKAGVKGVVAKFGALGVLVGTEKEILHYESPRVKIVSVTGAGDSLASATIWALRDGRPLDMAVKYGLAAAHLTLESTHALSPLISPEKLRQMVLN